MKPSPPLGLGRNISSRLAANLYYFVLSTLNLVLQANKPRSILQRLQIPEDRAVHLEVHNKVIVTVVIRSTGICYLQESLTTQIRRRFKLWRTLTIL
jgi:hypothetical protein